MQNQATTINWSLVLDDAARNIRQKRLSVSTSPYRNAKTEHTQNVYDAIEPAPVFIDSSSLPLSDLMK